MLMNSPRRSSKFRGGLVNSGCCESEFITCLKTTFAGINTLSVYVMCSNILLFEQLHFVIYHIGYGRDKIEKYIWEM